MTSALLKGCKPAPLKEYKGQQYIELDGRRLRFHNACSANCGAHPVCKYDCEKMLVHEITPWGSLRTECKTLNYGSQGTAIDMTFDTVQSTLDRWF